MEVVVSLEQVFVDIKRSGGTTAVEKSECVMDGIKNGGFYVWFERKDARSINKPQNCELETLRYSNRNERFLGHLRLLRNVDKRFAVHEILYVS